MITRLMVLGLLTLRPLSGYAIQSFLQLNQTEQWAGILPGSIYHALKKLTAEGLVTLEATEQTGHRTRAIYAITPSGVAELHRLLEEAWSTPAPHFPVGLYTALNFLDALPRVEVLAAIDRHIVALLKAMDAWNASEAMKLSNVPPAIQDYVRASFTNGREHMEVDLRFLRYLRKTLPAIPPVAMPLPSFGDGDEEKEHEQ